MQILLLEDVTGIGKRFEIVDVEQDHALKTLLPKRQGLIATPLYRKMYAKEIQKAVSSAD